MKRKKKRQQVAEAKRNQKKEEAITDDVPLSQHASKGSRKEQAQEV